MHRTPACLDSRRGPNPTLAPSLSDPALRLRLSLPLPRTSTRTSTRTRTLC